VDVCTGPSPFARSIMVGTFLMSDHVGPRMSAINGCRKTGNGCRLHPFLHRGLSIFVPGTPADPYIAATDSQNLALTDQCIGTP
jgi:hypothetical protein